VVHGPVAASAGSDEVSMTVLDAEVRFQKLSVIRTPTGMFTPANAVFGPPVMPRCRYTFPGTGVSPGKIICRRAAVKAAFPSHTFRITSTHNSITIRWANGPARGIVANIVERFKGSDHDVQSECDEIRDNPYIVRFISCERTISLAFARPIAEDICTRFGAPLPDLRESVAGAYMVDRYEHPIYDNIYRAWESTSAA
jgi:hypothetical protein